LNYDQRRNRNVTRCNPQFVRADVWFLFYFHFTNFKEKNIWATFSICCLS
jgi:hypothetical protein